MIRSKQEVDKQVSSATRNIANPHERNLKSYAFARMYYEAKDYDSALKYVSVYLGVNETDAKAHRLLGKIHEHNDKYEKAIESYKRSLELNNTQNDLILQVAELYCKIKHYPDKMRYWADKTEQSFPGHKTVFKLREHLLRMNKASDKELENFFQTEMRKTPDNLELNIKLAKMYKESKRVEDAYRFCIQRKRNKEFSEQLDWQLCVADTVHAYLRLKSKAGPKGSAKEIYLNLLEALCRVTHIALKEYDRYGDCSVCLARLDEWLLKAHQYEAVPKEGSDSEWSTALQEMRGQLYFLSGVLVTKMAVTGALEWQEAISKATTLYLASLQTPLPNKQTSWVAMAMRNPTGSDPLRWYRLACSRLSQVGHLVDNLCEQYSEKGLDKMCEKLCCPEGQEEIFYKMFSYNFPKERSYFFQDKKFYEVNTNTLPLEDDIIAYDEGALAENPHSLHNIIWLALQWYQSGDEVQPNVSFLLAQAFDKLHYAVPNMQTASVETICNLDIQSFVYAVVYCTKRAMRELYVEHHVSHHQPEILPQCLSKKLVSVNQDEWWSGVCALYTGKASPNERGKLRFSVQRGLEAVRVIGNHGMQVTLLVHLAKCFATRMNETRQLSKDPTIFLDEYLGLQGRAGAYWEAALAILQRMAQDLNVPKPKNPFFKLVETDLEMSKIREYIQEGKKFVASMTFEKGDKDRAVEIFESLGTADAAFNQAMIFKMLSDQLESKDNDATPDDEEKKKEYLKKSRDYLVTAINRLGSNSEDPLNQKISALLDDIELQLGDDQRLHRRLDFSSAPPSTVQNGTPSARSRRSTGISVLDGSLSPQGIPLLESTLRTDQSQMQSSSQPHLAAELRTLNDSHAHLVRQHAELQEKHSQLQGNYEGSQKQIQMLSAKLDEVMRQLKDLQSNKPAVPLSPQAQQTVPTGVTMSAQTPPTAQAAPGRTPTPEQTSHIVAQYLQTIATDLRELKRRTPAQVTLLQSPGPMGLQDTSYGYGYRPGYMVPPGHVPQMATQPGVTASTPRGYIPVGAHGLVSPAVDQGYMASPHGVPEAAHMAPGYSPSVYQGQIPMAAAPMAGPGQLEPKPAFDTGLPPQQPPPQSLFASPKTDSYFSQSVKNYNSSPQLPVPESAAGTRGGAGAGTQKFSLGNATQVNATGVIGKGESPSGATSNLDKSGDRTDEDGDASDVNYNEEEDDGIHFEPIVKMPEKVKLITGEEDEEVMFSMRSKLFRYDKESSQWKERGIGQIKIMHCKKSKKMRIVMRREQVLKVCANHYITKDMDMKPHKHSDRSWLWTALDFADGTPQQETFVVKFKTQEMAGEFKAKFEECREVVRSLPEQATPEKSTTPKKAGDKGKGTTMSLAEQFRPKPGTWECQECLVSNPADKRACLACNAAKPGSKPEKDAAKKTEDLGKAKSAVSTTGTISSTAPSGPTFTFGSNTSQPFAVDGSAAAPKSTGFTFAPSQGAGDSKSATGFSFGGSASKAAGGFTFGSPATGFSFGVPSQSQTPNVDANTNTSSAEGTSKFHFSAAKFTFGSSPQPQTAAPQEQKPPVFGTQGAGFTFGSPGGSASALLSSMAAQQKEDTADVDSSTPDNSAKAAAPAAISFGESAFKDFSFSSHGTTTSIRAIQESYRAQEDEDQFYEGGGAEDQYYEDEGEDDQYYDDGDDYYVYDDEDYEEEEEEDLRMPAAQHRSPLNRLGLSESTTPAVPQKPGLTKETGADEDVMFVSVTKPTDEQVRRARELMLPDGFYLYEMKPPCPGCRGCEDDESGQSQKPSSSFMGEPPRLIKKSELSGMADGKTLVIVTSPSKPAVGITKHDDNEAVSSTTEEGGTFGHGANDAVSFAALAGTASESSGFGKSPDSSAFKGFAGAGSKLFQSPKDGEDEYYVDDEGQHIHFEPVTRLPEKVDLKTGEEDEETLYCERARLYRFDHSSKQWKERGIGNIKLLRHREAGHIRVLMRRDQVFKVCANHHITTSMVLKPNAGSDRSWVWNAMDYADEKPQLEQLAVKFKSPEVASAFKVRFEECQDMLRQSPPKGASESPQESPRRAPEKEKSKDSPLLKSLLVGEPKGDKPELKPLSELFKPPPGSWRCNVCEVRNEANKSVCCACGTPSEAAAAKNKEESSGFSFGGPSDGRLGAFTFGYQPEKQEKPAVENKPFSGFTFGTSPTKPAQQTDEPRTERLPGLGASKSDAPKKEKDLNVSSASQEEGNEYYRSDDGEHIHVTPIVSMPKNVDLKTGEEDEDTLFSERSKLYRYDSDGRQWKERGLGHIKVLKHKETGQIRILMRREQVLKVCANHIITKDVKLEPGPSKDKSWIWHAMDFAEEEGRRETFTVKFKNSEMANAFKAKIEECQEMLQRRPEVGEKAAPGKDAAGKSAMGKKPTLAEQFRRTDVWECQTCLVSNPMKQDACLACSSMRPGSEKSAKSSKSAPESSVAIKFGSTESSGFTFGDKSGSGEGAEIKFGISSTTDGGGATFGFGTPSTTASVPGFTFGTQAPPAVGATGFSFGRQPATTTSGEATPSKASDAEPTDQKSKPDATGADAESQGKDGKSDKAGGLISPPKFSFGQGFSFTPASVVSSTTTPEPKKEVKTASPFAGFTFGHKPDTAGPLFGADEKAPKDLPKIDLKFDHDEKSDFVEIVYEREPTAEEVKEALKLQLPRTFYLYKYKAECPGCIGCNDERLPDDWNEWKLDAPTVSEPAAEVIEPDSTTDVVKPDNTVFGGAGASGTSFASVASTSSGYSFGKSDPAFHFKGAGRQLFSSPSRHRAEGGNDDDGDEVAPSDDIHFEPIVSLPKYVEVKTGEEDEVVLYNQRARLYRYDKEATQWKERGIGNVRLLKHPETGKIRVLMRREQVFKVCANHFISAEMELRPNAGSDRSWVWNALDFSEEEARNEQLALKFKTPEVAMEFKKKFEECQEMLRESKSASEEGGSLNSKPEVWSCEECLVSNKTTVSVCAACDAPRQQPAVQVEKKSGGIFNVEPTTWQCEKCSASNPNSAKACEACDALKPGRWECDGCLVRNKAEEMSCVACGTRRPGLKSSESDVSSTTALSSALKFGAPSGGDTGFTFGASPQTASSTTGGLEGTPFKFGQSGNAGFSVASTQSSGFSFGSPVTTTKPSVDTKSTFSFTPKFVLSGLGESGAEDEHHEVSSSTTITPRPPSTFAFASSQSPAKPPPPLKLDMPSFAELASSSCSSGFGFAKDLGTALSPKQTESPKDIPSSQNVRGNDSQDESYYKSEDDGDSIHFEPITRLPENVDLITGEENEEALSCHRAKLYRFDTELKQWKERGPGELKILKHRESGRVRILMRRDQVFKVCANHFITAEMALRPLKNSKSSWVWNAMDAAEDVPSHEQLAAKFKNPEVAAEFKAKFEEVQRLYVKASPGKRSEESESGKDDTLHPPASPTDVKSPKASSTPSKSTEKVKSCDPKLTEVLEEIIDDDKDASGTGDADQEER